MKFWASGALPEKFMNLVARSGINIWDIKNKDGRFSACVLANEYKSLRPLARKGNIKIRLKEKHGLPFILNKYRKRWGIGIGLFLFYVILKIFACFIWVIDVKGNNEISSEKIKIVMESVGLKEGVLKSKLDIPLLQQRAMMNLQDVSWLSINLNGCIAEVSIKERVKEPELVTEEKPCNIRASCDAQIDYIEAYRGEAVVSNGDAVVEGQLLVSGIVEDINGCNIIQHADAKVMAYTKRKIYDEVAFNQTKRIYTGKVINRKSMKLFNVEMPLTFVPTPKNNYSIEFNKKEIKIFDRCLPLTIFSQRFSEYVEENIVLTEKEAMEKLDEKFCVREGEEFKDILVLNKKPKYFIHNNKYCADVVYYCKENIAQEEEIILE